MGSASTTSFSLDLSARTSEDVMEYSRTSADAAATMLRWVSAMGSLLLLYTIRAGASRRSARASSVGWTSTRSEILPKKERTSVLVVVDFVAQTHESQVVLLHERFFGAGIAAHVRLLDEVFVGVENDAEIAAEADVERVFELHEPRMLGEEHFAVLLFQDARHRRQLFVLRNQHGGSTDGGEAQDG